jgi:aminopeptidase
MTSDFERQLERYANLVVKVGLNLQPGQRLLILAPIQTAPLIRLVTASAYQSGARLIDILWQDDQVTLNRYRYAPRDSFDQYPAWRADLLFDYAQHGDALLNIYATDPDLLKDQDPALIAIAQKTAAKYSQPFDDELGQNALNWLVISAPVASWAAKVFPQEPEEHQVERLWEAIFELCRLNQPDPVAALNSHLDQLVARSEYLNRKRYTALKYSAPGTDLTIGLPGGHIWKSARATSRVGITFTPNLPTEEVFTIPHLARTSGVVAATKPLNYGGNLIDNFRLTFAEGRVVEATAGSGEAILRDLLATDEGASRLGEVALVPHSSPIAQSGRLFYNTLFDENAACHIALGRAFKFNLDGGLAMSNEQFEEAGGNHSLIHVDFMIGSDQMDIDGLTEEGRAEPVMRAGEWAFEV